MRLSGCDGGGGGGGLWRAKTEAEVENEDARKMLRQVHDCAHTEKRRTEDDNDIPGTTEKTKYMREPLCYISSIV
jgi:hypothetical protein